MPSIYVASLSDYNAGRLHGTWIHLDRNTDPDEVWDEIERVLETSPTATETGTPAEEYAIHDHEGFGEVSIGEFEDLADVIQIASVLEEHGEIAAKIVAEGIASWDEVSEWIEEHDAGTWDSLEDYAEYLLEDALAGLPDNLRCYFDFGAYGRDLLLGGDVIVIGLDGKVRVFWNR